MLTSKQRAELRAQANGLDVTLIVGKEGITDTLIESAGILLESKELIKGKVLETSGLTAREASDQIAAATGADGVQCVGYKFVLYRKSKKLEAQRAAPRAKEAGRRKGQPRSAGHSAAQGCCQEGAGAQGRIFPQAAGKGAQRGKTLNEDNP